jgi:hypothetical protein
MAYDEQLADRIRTVLGDDPGIDERKMFGASPSCSTGTCSSG